MSSAAQTLIAIAIVPGMICWVVHEVRAAVAGLTAPASAPQCVDVRLIEAEAHVPRAAAGPALPATPDQWRIAA